MNKFAVCLWFNGKAEEAARYYCETFQNSRLGTIARYGEAGEAIPGRPAKDSVMTVDIVLDGLKVLALNGGPMFSITPGISMFVIREDAAEIERLYKALSANGSVLMPLQKYPFAPLYSWVQDQFGVSWQLIQHAGLNKIVPCMLFNGANRGKAAEAIDFYIEQFPNSNIQSMELYPPTPEFPKMVKHAVLNLNGQELRIMDANNDCDHPFTPGFSFIVYCATQEELDNIWKRLSTGGAEVQCGWLTDRYGVSWQIVPEKLPEWMHTDDSTRTQRVMSALLKMTKLDIGQLQQAFDSHTS